MRNSRWQVADGKWRAIRRLPLVLFFLLTACGPRPTATLTPARPPTQILTPLSVQSATLSASPSVAPRGAVPPVDLTICLADEPHSLYLYARPEAGRAHLLAALYDGPIEHVNHKYQPVLLEKLPSVRDGDAVVRDVVLNAGDTLVDEVGRVVMLTEGVTVALLNGEQSTYSGVGPMTVPQITATFKLKPGLRWSDGTPLTAHDSVFSYDVSLSPDSFDPRRALAERTLAYHAVDDTTVEWVGLPGYIDPHYFTNFWIPLPRHRYAGLTPSQIADSDEARFSPLGWGPFVLKEWARGERLLFERNPQYFRAGEGLPVAETITYIVITDPAQIVEALRSGQCALAPHSPALESVHESLTQLQFGHSVSGTALTYLYFGIAPAADYTRTVGNDFFADRRARQAIAHCLTWPSSGPSDPLQGRALFAELGWSDSDNDGLLDKNGTPLRLRLATNRPSPILSLQNCDIALDLQPLTLGDLMGDWPDGVVFGRRFDLAVLTWNVGEVMPCELWLTAQIPDDSNPAGVNAAGYGNPDFDAACRRARTTLDPAQAAQFYAEAQRLWARDLPTLPLFYQTKVAAARPEVQGFALDATSASELWAIEIITP